MPLLVSQIYASYLIYFFTCFIYSFSPKLPPFILYIYFIFLFFLFLYNIYIYSWWWANGPFFVLYYGSLIKNTRRREKSHFSYFLFHSNSSSSRDGLVSLSACTRTQRLWKHTWRFDQLAQGASWQSRERFRHTQKEKDSVSAMPTMPLYSTHKQVTFSQLLR